MSLPLSPDQLRAIADTIESLTDVLFADGERALGADVGEFNIPLNRPDCFEPDVIGYAVIDDGWIGFSFIDPLNKIGLNG